MQQYAEDMTSETDLLLLCFGFVLTQKHTEAWTTTTTTQNNNSKIPEEKSKQMSRKRTPLEPFLLGGEEEGVEARNMKKAGLTLSGEATM